MGGDRTIAVEDGGTEDHIDHELEALQQGVEKLQGNLSKMSELKKRLKDAGKKHK